MKFLSVSGSKPSTDVLEGVVIEAIYHDNAIAAVLISDRRGRLVKIVNDPTAADGLKVLVLANPNLMHNGSPGSPGNGGGGAGDNGAAER